MKRTLWIQVLLVVLLVLVSVGGARAQNGFGVDLDVDCDDVELRSLVRSYFSSELRSLGDVRVAEMGAPDFQVDVIAYIMKRNWTMSVVITAPFVGGSVEGHSAATDASLREFARPIEHSLSQGNSTNALERQIAEIVKAFDKEVLEPRRKG
jgi:hypothetical protein